eukprot:379360_1
MVFINQIANTINGIKIFCKNLIIYNILLKKLLHITMVLAMVMTMVMERCYNIFIWCMWLCHCGLWVRAYVSSAIEILVVVTLQVMKTMMELWIFIRREIWYGESYEGRGAERVAVYNGIFWAICGEIFCVVYGGILCVVGGGIFCLVYCGILYA